MPVSHRSTPSRATFRRRRLGALAVPVAVLALAVSCGLGGGGSKGAPGGSNDAANDVVTPHDHGSGSVFPGVGDPVTGVPTKDANALPDLYAHTKAGMFSPAVSGDRSLVYVPNLRSNTVSVIDPKTYRVIDTIHVGAEPQHVVPSWDLKTLYVNNNNGNSLTPIDPRSGKRGGPDIPVSDPYNLYFTPDGTYALVMAEALRKIEFYDPHTWKLEHVLDLGAQCPGVNHADFAPDGSYLIATCEFGGKVVKVDLADRKVVGSLDLNLGDVPSAPQDIKIDPYGQVWYVADMNRNGLWELSGAPLKLVGFLPTGPETHGLYPSRDGKYLYVANRGGVLTSPTGYFPHAGEDGSVSVVDFRTRRVVANWKIPGGGTPDMGNVSADGKTLWLSGRRDNVVYVFDTTTGALLHKIPVGIEPHGLAVWPLPGRYSLGHTGIL
ncbi:MAG TPA: hypothetical protein VHE83_09085, partial [Mycobacteriales bacterium]|nr:hypothetical protein [Mycobacteriales bacterium]